MDSDVDDEDKFYLLRKNEEISEKGQDKLGNWRPVNRLSVLASNYKFILTCLGAFGLLGLGIFIAGKYGRHESQKLASDAGYTYSYTNIRLPRDVLPLEYIVYLHPNLTTLHMYGIVSILLSCQKDTNRIILHTTQSTFPEIKVYKGNQPFQVANETSLVGIKELKQSIKLQQLYLDLKESLHAGQYYTVVINFRGTLRTDLMGFFRTSYKTKSGVKRYVAATNFEPVHARTAFPCFDEPDMKATFTIAIVRDPEYTAISNMPLSKSVKRKDGLMIDQFQQTVTMSTYLLAFVICDYKYKEKITKKGTRVRVWAPADKIEHGQFALNVAANVLDYYSDFYHMPFPLPKQDLIAVPEYAAGAEECWGAIQFSAMRLLHDDKTSDSYHQQDVATSVAHELAHQWFGNLVTMKWWNDLWLNEGFATFVEYIGGTHFKRSWKLMDQFTVEVTCGALKADSLGSSHPISVVVKDPAEVTGIFDSISYDKGASIIRMLQRMLGKKTFQKGLKHYLERYKFKNAETADLWNYLTRASRGRLDVKEVMDTWTLQMGYPLVTVTRDPKNPSVAIATQKHFLLEPGTSVPASPFNYKWEIPFMYKTSSSRSKLQWMHQKEGLVWLNLPPSSRWIKGNAGAFGFYRTNYDENNWRELIAQLHRNHKALSAADRANLIDDAFAISRGGQLNQLLALDLSSYLTKERHFAPWITAISSLKSIGDLLDGKGHKYFEKYMGKILMPLIQHLGWKDKGSHLQKLLRTKALKAAVNYGMPRAKKIAMALFRNWMKYSKYIPPNLRPACFTAGIKYGGIKEWNFVWKKYRTSYDGAEKRLFVNALVQSLDQQILQRFLNWTLDATKIAKDEATTVIAKIASNTQGQQLAWNFVKDNWNTIYSRYGTGPFLMQIIIDGVTSQFKNEEQLKDVKQFFETHQMGTAERNAKNAIERIKNRITWVKRNGNQVTRWLRDNST